MALGLGCQIGELFELSWEMFYDVLIVSLDLIFGRLRRNWSLGSVPPASSEIPSSSEVLDQEIKAGPTAGHKKSSVKEMLMSRLKEASPEGMALYEKYRPTYRDKQVVVRVKI